MKNFIFLILIIQILNACKISHKKNTSQETSKTEINNTFPKEKKSKDIFIYQKNIESKASMYDGSGKGIFGRKPIKKPKMDKDLMSIEGRMIFKVCIDGEGVPTYVQVIKRGTSSRNIEVLEKFVHYLSKFRWESIQIKDIEQCGKYTIKSDY